jgi:FAD/FMN-containing dehydrogenase/Fe-S oxidoreductase
VTSLQRTSLQNSGCEVASDKLALTLYASDASLHQITPKAVAFPRTAQEAGAIIRAAAESGLSVIPRGGGTGLVGGAIGDGLIIDFSRYNREISNIDIERRTVRVGAGVVLDQLNAALKPHGFCFGPDVATSSRATIGGMIGNNSSGSHCPYYGCTADHVRSAQVVLADGTIETLGENGTDSPRNHQLKKLVLSRKPEIEANMPGDLLKRWPGYSVERFLREPTQFNHLLAGSEGTLAAIISAELKISPLPKRKTLGVVFYASVEEAMQGTVDLLDLKPAAIEHVDDVLADQTKGQLAFKAARDLLELDSKPCKAMLFVDFFDETGEQIAEFSRRKLGLRTLAVTDPATMALAWNMRKAGLSLVTGCKGASKPVTTIEDAAVRPHQLPAYYKAVRGILESRNLHACYYGHAASGLLHVRPVLDLRQPGDLKKFREVSDEVAAVVKQFKGSFCSEHGVGMARTEYMPMLMGPELMQLFADIKNVFDPKNIFNPGKIIPDGRYKIDQDLRAQIDITLPFEPVLAFAAKDEGFIGNLEQCNGCGGCRKAPPTMCPTYVATGEEIMSTRGRANTIRAALSQRGNPEALASEELDEALANCLACKACTTECPSNVNLALLKAELLHARHEKFGMTLRERIFSAADRLGQMGCITPGIANVMLQSKPLRKAMEKFLGVAAKRPLPPYTKHRFDKWFHSRAKKTGKRGRVILWDDTFVRYHEPNIGQAAVKVLEAAGFEVALVKNRQCCGRPSFSQGDLKRASALGRHNLEILADGTDPILFLEPSCYSMFAEDYIELKLPNAKKVKARCFIFEQFIDQLLTREPGAIKFKSASNPVAIHAHCHAKSLLNPAFMKKLAERVPQAKATLLETGCCGMAGGFGATASKYELSVKVAEPLIAQIAKQPQGTTVIASGTSCRHQLEHLSTSHPLHFAEYLAAQLGT